MLSYKNVTTLFAFLCLSFEIAAQDTVDSSEPINNPIGIFYSLLLKGMPAPYDTTVAVRVDEYRRVRNKIFLADSLVDAKDDELARAYDLIQEKDSAQAVTLEIAAANARANERLTQTNAQLNRDYDELYLETSKPKPLIQRPWFLIAAGAVGGALLKSF